MYGLYNLSWAYTIFLFIILCIKKNKKTYNKLAYIA